MATPGDEKKDSQMTLDSFYKRVTSPHFNGPEYGSKHGERCAAAQAAAHYLAARGSGDHARLTRQIDRVRECMVDGGWRTLSEISDKTGDPHASVSAQLRHLRKKRFGSWTVERRARGDRVRGLFEYRLLVGSPGAP